MTPLILGSTRADAGKTTLLVGIARHTGRPFAYLKPFGDRLRYRRKRTWDYDTALVSRILGIKAEPEELSVGFDHAKLRYMYDADGVEAKLKEQVAAAKAAFGDGSDKTPGDPILAIEAAQDLAWGGSVHLDVANIARATAGRLVLVLHGDDDAIRDDLSFLEHTVAPRLREAGVTFEGVIANRVADPEDFRAVHADAFDKADIPLLGVVPVAERLSSFTMEFLAEHLFARVVAGSAGLQRTARNVLVGAMSVDAAYRHPVFSTPEKLFITSGDRSDMIVAAIENDSAGVVLSNDILPPSNIIARADELRIPLMLVGTDTFATAKRVDDMAPLLTAQDEAKLETATALVAEHLDLQRLLP